MARKDYYIILDNCYQALLDVTNNVSVHLTDENKPVEFETLTNCVKKYCILKARQGVRQQALDILKETEVEDMENKYEEIIEELTESSLDLDNDQYIVEFVNKKGHINNTDSMSNSSSSVIITGIQQTYRDPFTLLPIRNPVRSKNCNHVFEKDTLEQEIRQKNEIKCPFPGCPNKKIVLSEIVLDEELQQELANRIN